MLTRDSAVIPRRCIKIGIIGTGPTDIHPVASATFLEQRFKVVTLPCLKLDNPGQTTVVQREALTTSDFLCDQLHVLRILVQTDPDLAVVVRSEPDPVLAILRRHQPTTCTGSVVVIGIIVETGRPTGVRPRQQL